MAPNRLHRVEEEIALMEETLVVNDQGAEMVGITDASTTKTSIATEEMVVGSPEMKAEIIVTIVNQVGVITETAVDAAAVGVAVGHAAEITAGIAVVAVETMVVGIIATGRGTGVVIVVIPMTIDPNADAGNL